MELILLLIQQQIGPYPCLTLSLTHQQIQLELSEQPQTADSKCLTYSRVGKFQVFWLNMQQQSAASARQVNGHVPTTLSEHGESPDHTFSQ